MKYFSRIVLILDSGYSFLNVTDQKRELFRNGNMVCTIHSDTRLINHRLILEYGPFDCKETAVEYGRDLVRQLKIYMAEHEVPIYLTGRIGGADPSRIAVYYGGIEGWDALPANQEREAPLRPAYENGSLGLAVYSVENSLDDLKFIDSEVSLETSKSFVLQNMPLAFWDESMDLSLSLITSSVGLSDNRVALLLRIMAVEVLVSKSEPRRQEEFDAIDKAINALDNIGLNKEEAHFIKDLLSSRKQKSVQQKVKSLLTKYLPDSIYGGNTAPAFFDHCYYARSAFTHSGRWERITSEMIYELKKLCIDLLRSISGTSGNQL